ncbi:HEAT repeat domain-containing protein [Streptomyces sp. NPDC004610]|uniref:HEAT repeat domain-containing protein n=1 Tax=unclassified Streptomyces TaxID=2593676 RepID=UPI0033B5541B
MSVEKQLAHFLRALATGDRWQRAAAAKGLGALGRPEHAPVLVASAADPAPEVREGAAAGLARLGVPEAGYAVLPGLMADRDPWVRRRASLSAARLGLRGPRVRDAFTALLQDPDHHLRINALDGLRAFGVPGDAAGVVRLLGDPVPEVWGPFGVPGDAAGVVQLLGDPVPEVRGRARSLLHDHRDDPAVDKALLDAARWGPELVRVRALELLPSERTGRLLGSLLTGLGDPSPEVRTAVVERLLSSVRDGTAPPGAVTDALFAALAAEPHPRVAARLLHGLARPGEERLLAPARHRLGDPRSGPSAVHALGVLGTRAAASALRTALTDRTLDGRTRAAAAGAYGGTGRRDAVPLLLGLLAEGDGEVRAGAVDGLGALVEAGARPWERGPVARALVACLGSGRVASWRTYNALLGLAEALPGLRALVDRGAAAAAPADIRAAALALLDPDNATDADSGHDLARFVRALADPDAPVREAAAEGLAHTVARTRTPPPDADRVRERLTGLGSDASPGVRAAAGAALRALDDCR